MADNDTQTHTDSIVNIADELLSEMPAPQPSAMQPPVEKTEEPKSAHSTVWNPEIHATGPDGKGILTAKGEWRRRRGASKRQSVVGGVSTSLTVPPADVQAARAAGAACAQSFLMTGMLIGGAEWAPRGTSVQVAVEFNESAMLEQAFGDYFVAKKVTDFPPGVALAMALIAYTMPRLTMPQTRSRLQRLKEWTAAKYAKWKVRKQPKDEKPREERKESSGKQQPTR